MTAFSSPRAVSFASLTLLMALAGGCQYSLSRASVSPAAIVNAGAGWSIRDLQHPRRALMPPRWRLPSHDPRGNPIDPLDDLVIALDFDGDGEGDRNVHIHRFEVRYEEPSTESTIWLRLVPLDLTLSRRALVELGALFAQQLRTTPPLDAAIATRTAGKLVPGTSGGTTIANFAGSGTTVSFGPAPEWVDADPSARVVADVHVLAARDASVGGAPARQLIIDVSATPDPATDGLRRAAIARGDFSVPDRARLAVTLVRLPERFEVAFPNGRVDVPLVLLAAYAPPPERFEQGLADYRSLLRRMRVDAGP